VKFAPDAVISDFDSFAYLFAKRHGLPILSIDNQQIISRCKHERVIKEGVQVDYQMTKAFVRAKLPGCDHYIITTFFFPPVRKRYRDSTTLVPPILRKPVLDAKKTAKAGDHVLVYQTSTSDKSLVPTLQSLKARSSSSTASAGTSAPATAPLKDFSEEGFVAGSGQLARHHHQRRSLAHRRGHLPRQAHLQRPREEPVRAGDERAIPRGARLWPRRRAHRGRAARPLPQGASAYAARVAKHKQDGNKALFDAVDEVLVRFAKSRSKKRA